MKSFLILHLILFSSVVSAQFIPLECSETELKKEFNGSARLAAARSIHGSGQVDSKVKPKPNEHGISAKDLEKEIVYYDPIKKKCSFSTVGNTPFGTWIKGELAWRKLQKLVPPDLTYHPVEIDAAYTAAYWRTLSLTSQASLFDRRAAQGMRAVIDSATNCSSGHSNNSPQLFTSYAETFLKYYHANLKDYITAP